MFFPHEIVLTPCQILSWQSGVILHACNSRSAWVVEAGGLWVRGQPGKSYLDPISRTKTKMLGGIVQVAECLPSKCEVLGSIPSTAHTRTHTHTHTHTHTSVDHNERLTLTWGFISQFCSFGLHGFPYALYLITIILFYVLTLGNMQGHCTYSELYFQMNFYDQLVNFCKKVGILIGIALDFISRLLIASI
jgi:hypothetical protein